MSEIPWTWFVMRSTGLVAVGLLTLAVVLGIVAPRLRPTPRLALISTHRAASAAGALLVILHVVLAVLDPWIELGWAAVVVPGAAGWKPWGIAAGAVAVDLMLLLLATTATRRWAPRLWRRVHLVAYPVWVLAVGHGLLVGSDGALMRGLAVVCLAMVLGATSMRLLLPPATPVALGPTYDEALAGGIR